MADDRNKTGHTYIETVAVQIYGQLMDHSVLLTEIVNRISEKNGKI